VTKRPHLGHWVDLQGGDDGMRLGGADGHNGVNSGEPPQAMQGARMQTNGTVILLTS
jgi:hypothetical protein